MKILKEEIKEDLKTIMTVEITAVPFVINLIFLTLLYTLILRQNTILMDKAQVEEEVDLRKTREMHLIQSKVYIIHQL